jgi:hypothetical protein
MSDLAVPIDSILGLAPLAVARLVIDSRSTSEGRLAVVRAESSASSSQLELRFTDGAFRDTKIEVTEPLFFRALPVPLDSGFASMPCCGSDTRAIERVDVFA